MTVLKISNDAICLISRLSNYLSADCDTTGFEDITGKQDYLISCVNEDKNLGHAAVLDADQKSLVLYPNRIDDPDAVDDVKFFAESLEFHVLLEDID